MDCTFTGAAAKNLAVFNHPRHVPSNTRELNVLFFGPLSVPLSDARVSSWTACQNFHIKGTWSTVPFSKLIAKQIFLLLRIIYMQKNSLFSVSSSTSVNECALVLPPPQSRQPRPTPAPGSHRSAFCPYRVGVSRMSYECRLLILASFT